MFYGNMLWIFWQDQSEIALVSPAIRIVMEIL